MAIGTSQLWADALHKVVYKPGYYTVINQRTPAKDLLLSGNKIPFLGTEEGKYIHIMVVTGSNPNNAVGLAEGKGLPSGSVATVDKMIYTRAWHYQSATMTEQALTLAPGGAKSIVSAYKLLLETQKAGASRKVGWLLHGDGSGEIGVLTSSTTGTSVVLAAKTNLAILKKDAELIIRNRTTGARLGGQTAGVALKVTNVTGSRGPTPTVTVANADGSALSLSTGSSSYGLYWYDSQGSSMCGLGNLCSDQNPGNWGSATAYFGGVDRSNVDNAWHRAFRMDAGGAAVDVVTHIQPMLDNIDELAGDSVKQDSTLYGFCGYDVWRQIGNQLTKPQRTEQLPTVKGGYQYVEYDRIKFIRDQDSPFDKLRFLDPKTAYRYMPEDWKPIDKDGSIWIQVSNMDGDGRENDAWKMRLRMQGQVIAALCNGNGELYNISASR